MSAVTIARIRIRRGRMRVELTWDSALDIQTDSRISNAALRRYPTLKAHSCINSRGPSFGHVISDTNIPHLIEHIAIEEQLERMAGSFSETLAVTKGFPGLYGETPESIMDDLSDNVFVGTTRINRLQGRAVVEISFLDDVIAAQSVLSAVDFVNDLLSADAVTP